MNALLPMLRWDIKLQARHHIFTANLVSTLFICGFVLLLPADAMTPNLASFFVFSDPALIGLSFVGAIVLMEKAMRVQLALGVTPSPAWSYVSAKTIVLTLAGTASGLAVAFAALGAEMNWILMIWALLLANAVAVLLGFLAVARCSSMNDLLIKLLYVCALLFAPLASHFDLVPPLVDYILGVIPSAAMLFLLEAASTKTAPDLALVALSSAYLMAWIGFTGARAITEYRDSILSEGR